MPARDNLDAYARIDGSPGERPRLSGLLRAAGPPAVLIFVLGLLIGAALPLPPLGPAVLGTGFLVLALVGVVILQTGRQRLERFFKGARGEESVARALALLPAEFRVFHGVSPGSGAPGRDIDHVVIGPTGVFAVETKNWSGAISVQDGAVLYDGMLPDRPPLEQARLAASALERLLQSAVGDSVPVQPVLCFAGSRPPRRVQGAAGVVICIPESIAEVIEEPNPDAPDRTLLDRAARRLSP